MRVWRSTAFPCRLFVAELGGILRQLLCIGVGPTWQMYRVLAARIEAHRVSRGRIKNWHSSGETGLFTRQKTLPDRMSLPRPLRRRDPLTDEARKSRPTTGVSTRPRPSQTSPEHHPELNILSMTRPPHVSPGTSMRGFPTMGPTRD